MSTRVPDAVRRGLRQRLWALADTLDWHRLNWYEKTAHYEAWTSAPDVGGLLANYMDSRQIRVYIKDTVMKGYVRSRQAGMDLPFSSAGISPDTQTVESWERPHGRRLADGRVIAWGNAEDWKLVVLAVIERSWGVRSARPFAAVLLSSVGKFAQPSVRAMVEDAARRLGIEKLVWID